MYVLAAFCFACLCRSALLFGQVPNGTSTLKNHDTLQLAPASEFVVQYTPSGCVYTPADTPVCAIDNVCFGKGYVDVYIAPFTSEQWPWRTESNVSGETQGLLDHAWATFERRCCRHRSGALAVSSCLRAERLGLSCCRQHYKTTNRPKLMTTEFHPQHTSAFILDTAVDFYQFGHTISKLLQFVSLSLWATHFAPPSNGMCSRPFVTAGIFSRIDGRPVPKSIQQWIEFVSETRAAQRAADILTTSRRTVFDALKKNIAHPNQGPQSCAKRAYLVLDYEQYFFRSFDATYLSTEAERLLGHPKCPKDGQSAGKRGMLLVRTEGSGGRALTNVSQVKYLVQSVFGVSLDSVVIDSTTDIRLQSQVFRQYGLIISSHSSQLKNLALACPCTIVIEINALDGTREPFSVGLHHRNMVYVQSSQHNPESHGRTFAQKDLRTLDVRVNITKLDKDMREALEKHRHSGCNVF
jgi:hypothetical protein